jgi:hypothetical protein
MEARHDGVLGDGHAAYGYEQAVGHVYNLGDGRRRHRLKTHLH